MAITIITKDNNMGFLQNLGFTPAQVAEVTKSGLSLHLGINTLEIKSPTGVTLQKIKLAAPINSIMKNTAPPNVKKAVHGAVTSALSHALLTLTPGTATPKPTAPSTVSSITGLLKSPVLPLEDAEMLYQPVRGTSNGSKYFLVARAGSLKVAARVMANSVSVRVVGTDPVSKQAFIEQGMNDKGDHLSVHFEANHQATPHKIIGALLMGTGIAFDTTLPSVDYIVDKGA